MNTDEHGLREEALTLFQKLNWVIERGCERKALRPQRILLPAYPGVPVHTDQFYVLSEGPRDVEGFCRSEPAPEELKHIISAINEIENALKKHKTS